MSITLNFSAFCDAEVFVLPVCNKSITEGRRLTGVDEVNGVIRGAGWVLAGSTTNENGQHRDLHLCATCYALYEKTKR